MLTTAKSNPRYSTVSVLGNLTPPATPDNSSCHDQPTELSDILSHSRIIAALVPHLLLSDFLNLTMVSRSTRVAVLWHSVPRCSFGLAGGPQTAELEALQHFMVLISLTGRCKSSHKAPVRIGVGACVWCGEGVCQVYISAIGVSVSGRWKCSRYHHRAAMFPPTSPSLIASVVSARIATPLIWRRPTASNLSRCRRRSSGRAKRDFALVDQANIGYVRTAHRRRRAASLARSLQPSTLYRVGYASVG
jgi:hypothetical protein